MYAFSLYVGIGADLLTFAGSVLLAKEAVQKVKNLKRVTNLKRGAREMTERF